MSCHIGIDLGSTTSKAVLVDDEGKVMGRGITNTRSNYDVAARMARADALADARFGQTETVLTRRLGAEGTRLSQSLRRATRIAQAMEQLHALADRVVVLARNAPGGGDGEAKAIAKIFEKMLAEPEVVFGGLADDRSRFFRDAAGGRFLTDAEMASREKKLSFEVAAGAYDRAIVEIENAEREWEASKIIDRALELVPVGNAEAAVVREAWYASEVKLAGMVGTGYGRQRLPFPKESIRSEILCHGLGASAFFPETRTVLDIGGQDTKAIQVDGAGIVTSFQMNDRCAAGCGRYLGYIADEMNLGVHELGPIALTARRPAKITSTCTVFAGVELRELLSLGERRENILLGLHRAIVLRAMSLLARSGGVKDEMTFTGGVARNVAVVQELRDLVKRHYGERKINIHTDSIYTGALGAAIFAKRAAHAEV